LQSRAILKQILLQVLPFFALYTNIVRVPGSSNTTDSAFTEILLHALRDENRRKVSRKEVSFYHKTRNSEECTGGG